MFELEVDVIVQDGEDGHDTLSVAYLRGRKAQSNLEPTRTYSSDSH
jgi:hypothetical protein